MIEIFRFFIFNNEDMEKSTSHGQIKNKSGLRNTYTVYISSMMRTDIEHDKEKTIEREYTSHR